MIKGIGIDIIKISRINDNLSLIQKILHIEEIKILEKITNKKRRLEFLAGRWAIKEAIYKSNSLNKKIAFCNINVRLHNDKLQWVEKEHQYFLSLSHEEEYAIGLAIMI